MSGQSGRGVLMVRTESSAGTYIDATTSSQALLVDGFEWSFAGSPMVDRSSLVAATPAATQHKVGAFYMEASFSTPAYQWGDTSAAAAHPHATLYRASPMTTTLGGGDGDDLTIRPLLGTSGVETFSMVWQNESGNLYKFRGCRCALEEITSDATGDIVMQKWKVQGLWEATPAAGAIDFSTVSYGSYVEVSALGATIDIGVSGAVGLSSWKLTTGQVLRPRTSQGESYGHLIPHVGHEGYAKLECNVEEVVEGTFAVWAAALATTAAGVSLTFPGGSDTFAIDMPAATPLLPKLGDRDGLSAYALTFQGHWSARHYGLTFS